MIPRLDRIESMDTDTEYETGCMAGDGDSGVEDELWNSMMAKLWPNLNPYGLRALEGDTIQQRLGSSHDFTAVICRCSRLTYQGSLHPSDYR
jgi:hypothetical protein